MNSLLIIFIWMALPNKFGLCLLKSWNNAVPTIIFCFFPFFYVDICRDTMLTML